MVFGRKPSKALLEREAAGMKMAHRKIEIGKDLEAAQAMIADCDDIGTLLKMQRAQEDKIKKMEVQAKQDEKDKAERMRQAEEELNACHSGRQGLVARRWGRASARAEGRPTRAFVSSRAFERRRAGPS